MKLGVKVVSIKTDEIMHITGGWNSIEEMEEELEKDGYIVIKYWHMKKKPKSSAE